ncbi:hypothetical protein BDAP_001456 [Binucleata daphniae]
MNKYEKNNVTKQKPRTYAAQEDKKSFNALDCEEDELIIKNSELEHKHRNSKQNIEPNIKKIRSISPKQCSTKENVIMNANNANQLKHNICEYNKKKIKLTIIVSDKLKITITSNIEDKTEMLKTFEYCTKNFVAEEKSFIKRLHSLIAEMTIKLIKKPYKLDHTKQKLYKKIELDCTKNKQLHNDIAKNVKDEYHHKFKDELKSIYYNVHIRNILQQKENYGMAINNNVYKPMTIASKTRTIKGKDNNIRSKPNMSTNNLLDRNNNGVNAVEQQKPEQYTEIKLRNVKNVIIDHKHQHKSDENVELGKEIIQINRKNPTINTEYANNLESHKNQTIRDIKILETDAHDNQPMISHNMITKQVDLIVEGNAHTHTDNNQNASENNENIGNMNKSTVEKDTKDDNNTIMPISKTDAITIQTTIQQQQYNGTEKCLENDITDTKIHKDEKRKTLLNNLLESTENFMEKYRIETNNNYECIKHGNKTDNNVPSFLTFIEKNNDGVIYVDFDNNYDDCYNLPTVDSTSIYNLIFPICYIITNKSKQVKQQPCVLDTNQKNILVSNEEEQCHYKHKIIVKCNRFECGKSMHEHITNNKHQSVCQSIKNAALCKTDIEYYKIYFDTSDDDIFSKDVHKPASNIACDIRIDDFTLLIKIKDISLVEIIENKQIQKNYNTDELFDERVCDSINYIINIESKTIEEIIQKTNDADQTIPCTSTNTSDEQNHKNITSIIMYLDVYTVFRINEDIEIHVFSYKIQSLEAETNILINLKLDSKDKNMFIHIKQCIYEEIMQQITQYVNKFNEEDVMSILIDYLQKYEKTIDETDDHYVYDEIDDNYMYDEEQHPHYNTNEKDEDVFFDIQSIINEQKTSSTQSLSNLSIHSNDKDKIEAVKNDKTWIYYKTCILDKNDTCENKNNHDYF